MRVLDAVASDRALAGLLQQLLVETPNPRDLVQWSEKNGMILEVSSTKTLKLRVPNRHDQLLISNLNSSTDARFIRSKTGAPSFFHG